MDAPTRRNSRRPAAALLAVTVLSTPLAVGESRASRPPVPEREFTLGLVQKEIRLGMAQAEVAEALGSPNIVTRDGSGRDAWIYDKIATEVTYTRSRIGAGGSGAFTPGASAILTLVGGSREKGTLRSTQKTLTVVVKFDDAAKVERFSYHASRF